MQVRYLAKPVPKFSDNKLSTTSEEDGAGSIPGPKERTFVLIFPQNKKVSSNLPVEVNLKFKINL